MKEEKHIDYEQYYDKLVYINDYLSKSFYRVLS